MKSIFFQCVTTCVCCAVFSVAGAEDADTASAYVNVTAARMGIVADVVTAYGTVTPALDLATVLNVQAAGHVSHFAITPGAQVRRGQHLLDYELAPTAVAMYMQSKSAVALARQQRLHVAQLLAQQLATKDQLAQATKALDDAESSLNALEKQQGAGSSISLRAPFDGTVTAVTATPGDTLAAGAPLLTLLKAGGAQVTVGVELPDIQRVKPGESVKLQSLDESPPLQGTVLRIAHDLNPRTRMLDVDIALADKPALGAAFRADIAVGQFKGWLIPRDAVIDDGSHRHVFQVASGKAVEVPVTVMGGNDTTTVVLGPLQSTRPLIVVGVSQLDDGMAVRIGNSSADITQ